MPKCKNCNAEISRLDKDICPFCGEKKPLEGQETYTEDFTKAFSAIETEDDDKVFKSRKVTGILAMTLGVFGVHMFYVGRKKLGFLILLISLAFIAGIGSILFFGNILRNAFAFVLPYIFIHLLMLISGILILTSHNGVDGNGEYLK